MASVFLSPIGGAAWQFFTDEGVVLSGGLLYTYLAETTTPAATFTTASASVTNPNPIVLNSSGRTPNEIWLTQGQAYKFVVETSTNVLVTPGTWDNISGINDVSISSSQSVWVSSNLTPTFISTTTFSVPGNNTSIFTVNRRIQAVIGAGTVYGYVSASSFGSSITTVTVVLDSGVLDSGLSSILYGQDDPTHSSINPFLNVQVFTSSGTYTPTNGATKILVKAVGGGGGGGGAAVTTGSQTAAGQGGGAGAYAEVYIPSGITAQTVTIGAGGSAGVAGTTNGSAGGTTSFGALISCPGGTGAQSAGATTPPQVYGTPSSSSPPTVTGNAIGLILASGPGGFSGITMAVSDLVSGAGAGSPFGAGGSAATTNNPGNVGKGYGSGGSGASATGTGGPFNGGVGNGGCIVVYEYV
jgi:hypothetical protein